jgi:hypothetical protein
MAKTDESGTEALPPLLIVRAEGDGVALARDLANVHPGPGIDLRPSGEPVLPQEIAATARAIAAEQPARNLESRRRREDALLVALEEAKVAHQTAREQVGSSSATHHQLLSNATWCEERAETAAALSAVLFEAEGELAAARERFAEAEARVAAVNEQQAAAEAVLEEAQRQLLELDVAGQSENEVRRSLESANHAAREANADADAARARADELATSLAAAQARIGELETERDDLLRIAEVDPAPVARALDRVVNTPLVDPDDATLTLADDLERRVADLDALGPAQPPPTPEELSAAEAAVAAARGAVEELRRPTPNKPPSWWDELAVLHAEVVDAEAAAGAKRARGSTRKRLEEALAAERALLDELGYPSHLDALLSGGRPATASLDPNALPQAQEVLASAEARLHSLYDVDAVAANHRRLRSDVLRMRALGAALLGLAPSEVDPDRLRQRRPDPTVADHLVAALRAAGSEPDDSPLADRARAWLSARETASTRLRAVEQETQALTGRIRSLTVDTEAASATAEEAAATARTARRQVEVLEAEMVNRMRPAADPATRAATAAALRDHIAALEARVTAAKSEAESGQTAASTALASATARFDNARRDTDDLARRATLAARLLPDGHDNGDQLLGDLGSLADALREEYKSIDDGLGDLADAVAAAATAEAELAASLAELRAGSADDPEPVDQADALRRLLDPATRTSDVVLDPVSGFRGDAREPIVEALLELGTARPIVVVDINDDLGAWALGLESGVAVVVSADDASTRLTSRR